MPVLEVKKFEQLSEGTHTAICYGMVDLGTQKSEWQGKTKINRKFIWLFETPDELMSDGRPFSSSMELALVGGENANLTKIYKMWEGRVQENGFDPASQVGKACNITVVHEPSKDGSKTYVNIASITPLKKGEKVPPQTNPSLIFDLDDYNEVVFENLPEWMKKKIALSPEFATPKRKAQNPHTPKQDNGDDGFEQDTTIPF